MPTLSQLQDGRYRTGKLQQCFCKPLPFPYELEEPDAKTANDAAVLRDALRKYSHSVRTGCFYDDGRWALPLSPENVPRQMKPDLLNKLPTELLGQILIDVYNSTEMSTDICTCSRPKTPYATVKLRSLVHRVVDSFPIRLTCARWHSWVLKFVLSGPLGDGQQIELDVSHLSSGKKMRLPVGGIAKRLVQDFPFLFLSGITLYLGNPGEISNLILVAEMLVREKTFGGSDYQVFRGVSFWDLNHSVREIAPQVPWNGDSLLLLDILSHFAKMLVSTHVQFPTTIFATIPRDIWRPVFDGILRHSDCLSLREFLIVSHPSNPSGNARPSSWAGTRVVDLPKVSSGNYLDLPEYFSGGQYSMPEDLDRYCSELHSNTSFGFKANLHHLTFSLKSDSGDQTQKWRIDDALLVKFSCYNLNKLVSVQIDGGLASSLTIDSLLQLLQPSRGTLKKLIFRPESETPGEQSSQNQMGEKHHCQVLSILNLRNTFPELEILGLYIPCCPDIFRLSDHQYRDFDSKNSKRHWTIEIPKRNRMFLGFCPEWTRRENVRNWLSQPLLYPVGAWTSLSLKLVFEAARTARRDLLARDIGQAESMQRELEEITLKMNEFLRLSRQGMQQDLAAQIADTMMAQQQLEKIEDSLIKKWKEISEKWKLEIHMKDVKIADYADQMAISNLIFQPLAIPPMVTIQVTTIFQGQRTCWKKTAESHLPEADFLKGIRGNAIQ